MGRPPIFRSGFGIRSVRGRSRVPSPAPRMNAVLNRLLFIYLENKSVTPSITLTPRGGGVGGGHFRIPLFHCSKSLFLFFPKLRINLYQRCYDKTWDRRSHDPEEIVLIT